MVEGVRTLVRYEMPWMKLKGLGGKTETVTRRAYNEGFNQAHLTPDIEVPEDGEHIWEWFWHLSSMRPSGMNGPQPLSYRDIEAWVSLTGTLLLREEIAIILKMDVAYLSQVSDEQEAQREADK